LFLFFAYLTVTLNVTKQTPGSLWFINANLKLWLDHDSSSTPFSTTKPSLAAVSIDTTPPIISVSLDPNHNNDMNITTTLERRHRFLGFYNISNGLFGMEIWKNVSLCNHLEFRNNTQSTRGVHNLTVSERRVVKSFKENATFEVAVFDAVGKGVEGNEGTIWGDGVVVEMEETTWTWPLRLELDLHTLNANGSQYLVYTSIEQSFEMETKRIVVGSSHDMGSRLAKEVLRNDLIGSGYFGTATYGLARTQQRLDVNMREFCFKRHVEGLNRTLIEDKEAFC
jgi:hypothetical protein